MFLKVDSFYKIKKQIQNKYLQCLPFGLGCYRGSQSADVKLENVWTSHVYQNHAGAKTGKLALHGKPRWSCGRIGGTEEWILVAHSVAPSELVYGATLYPPKTTPLHLSSQMKSLGGTRKSAYVHESSFQQRIRLKMKRIML